MQLGEGGTQTGRLPTGMHLSAVHHQPVFVRRNRNTEWVANSVKGGHPGLGETAGRRRCSGACAGAISV